MRRAPIFFLPLCKSASRALTDCVLAGCGAAAPQGPTIAPPKPPPSVVSDATFDEVLRHYWVLSLDDPQRAGLRDRLVEHLLSKTSEVIAKDDYEAAVAHLAAITGLYTPTEIATNQLPPGLESLAKHLIERGSPRGDEARVLSALSGAPRRASGRNDVRRAVPQGQGLGLRSHAPP